jgi:hypothetical protein
MRERSVRSFALGVLVGGALLLSCGGITSTVEVLRAQRIEIIDSSDRVTMDLVATVQRLEQRVAELETRPRSE